MVTAAKFTAAKSPPMLFSLVLLTGLSTLSLNMFLPSLSNMARDLGTDYATVSFAIAGYLATTAVLHIVLGPLSDRFGRRPVMLCALAVFSLASLGCTLTTDIWLFLAFRLLQGAIVAGWAVSLAVIRDTAPPQEAAGLIGFVSMAMAVAPMVGPTIGGLLDEVFGWRASFVVYTALGAVALVLCWVDLGETNRSPSRTLSAQLRTYPVLLGAPKYWCYAACTAFSTGSFYAFLAGAPAVAVAFLGLSPGTLGVCLGLITAGFTVGSFVSGRLAKRARHTTMMIAGRLVGCSGCLAGLGLFLLGHVNEASLFGAAVFVGLGNGLTMPSGNAGAISVQPRLAGSAAGLVGALTVGCGAVVTFATGAVTGALLEKTGANDPAGAYALLGIMLFCAMLGLLAALAVQRFEAREAAVAEESQSS